MASSEVESMTAARENPGDVLLSARSQTDRNLQRRAKQ